MAGGANRSAAPTDAAPVGRAVTASFGRERVGRLTFRAQMAVAAGIGFVARLVALEWWYRGKPVLQDAPEYWSLGMRVAEGRGWTSPFSEGSNGIARQTANHPPLTSAWIALGRPFDVTEVDRVRIWMVVLGIIGVVLVGYLGRALAGPAVGRIAAGIAALSPAFWQNDLTVMAETAAQTTTALVLLLAVRYRRSPSLAGAAWMAGAVGLAALARSELLLFLPPLVVPLCLVSPPARQRIPHLLAAGLWVVVALAPWVGWNLVRFEKPVLMTTGVDLTVAQANCPLSYYGRGTGRWSAICAYDVEFAGDAELLDESQLGARYRAKGTAYARSEADRLPAVVYARLGRTFGWYHPIDQLDVEQGEGQERAPLVMGLPIYLITLAAAAYGVVVARRRKIVVWPLLIPFAVVAVSVAISRGGLRFRAPVEVSLAVLAAVALAALWDRWSAVRSSPAASSGGVDADADAGATPSPAAVRS